MTAAEVDRICLHNLLDGDPESVFFKDVEGRYLHLSRAHAYSLGVDNAQDVVGSTAFDVLPPEEAQNSTDDDRSIMRTGVSVVELQEHIVREGRDDAWLVTTKQPLRDFDGEVIGTFGVTRDITARKLMEQRIQAYADQVATSNAELLRAERDLRTMLDSSPDFTARYDRQLRMTYANPAIYALAGMGETELIGHSHRELDHVGPLIEELEPALLRVLSTGVGCELEFELDTGDGPIFLHTRLVPDLDEDGAVTGILSVSRDLTDRKRAEDLLADRAVRDPLTGLANRVLLTDRVEQAILRLDREPGMLAVLFLDLDRFKVVNDSLGHGAGDALLIEVARRLGEAARRIDTIARFGGDEFVVLCERLMDAEDAAMVADRIGRALAAPFFYEGQELHPTASLGIAITSTSSTTAEILIRDADAAMYQAKDKGRGNGTYQIFDAGVRERAVARLSIENDLRHALDLEEFELVYQPLESLADRRLTGVEALIRWRRADGSLMSPADFIPVAEDSGLIVQIGRWVLDEALRQLAHWNSEWTDGPPLTMAVNLSARQLTHTDLVADVAAALERHGIEPHLLCLEVTETALLEEALATAEAFRQLSALGVQLALDDFGTGYSSLGHLRRYPVNILKIDRMFVEGLNRGSDEGAIIAAVTAMARALGMTTVGEGIETSAQLDELLRLGCDDGQGYWMAHPLPPWAIEAEHLRGHRRTHPLALPGRPEQIAITSEPEATP